MIISRLSMLETGKEENWNVGSCNAGDYNVGARNMGNWNTGSQNAGDCNTGDCNVGAWNAGNWNHGDWNTGDQNKGDRNTGSQNTGHHNTGNQNKGDRNVGDWNKSSFNNGCFNTEESYIFMFNNPTNLRMRDWIHSRARALLERIPKAVVEWVCEDNMTDEEKAANPVHKKIGGYLRVLDEAECAQIWWDDLDEDDKNIIRSMPNFNADVFYECTGIRSE